MKILFITAFTILQTVSNKFGLNENTTLLMTIIFALLVISVYAYEVIQNHRQEYNQDLFNRWSIFLITTNIQYEDNLRSKDSTDFRPYKVLLDNFTLNEIKELKKNNYFKLNFNIQGYEMFISIFNLFCEMIEKIDFSKHPTKTAEPFALLDSPKENKK
jgi:hypothetical protein